MKMRLPLIWGLAWALGACQVFMPAAGLPPKASVTTAAGSVTPGTPGGAAQGPAPDLSAYGTLKLVIRWPSGGGTDLRGYHAQLIPDSTAQIDVAVLNGGTVVASGSVSRLAGQPTATVDLRLKAASNLSVTVSGFATGANAPAGPIAVGSAAGVNIVRSEDTYVPISMTSIYTPVIEALSDDAGAVGDQVTLTGTNLLPPWAAAGPLVTFRSNNATVSAPVVASAGSGSLTVQIPSGAVVGPIGLVVDGVPAATPSPVFFVGSNLSIAAASASWDASPAGQAIDLFDSPLALSSTLSWVLAAGDQIGNYTPPTMVWNAASGSAGVLTQSSGASTAFLAASTEGLATVSVSVGSLLANYFVNVLAIGPMQTYAPVSLLRGSAGQFNWIGSSIYEFGDASSSVVDRYGIDSTGNLTAGATASDMVSQLGGDPVVIGDNVYVVAGSDPRSGSQTDVARTSFTDFGSFLSLAPFDHLSQTAMPGAAGAQVVGNYLYEFGGGQDHRGVERSAIDSNGNLVGGWQSLGDPYTVNQHTGRDSVVIWPYVYLIGGSNPSNQISNLVERASILDPQGDLGTFQGLPGGLNQARSNATSFLLNGALYVVGGDSANGVANVTQIERAVIDSAGNLGSFVTLQTPSPQIDLTSLIPLGNWLYLLGGNSCGGSCQPIAIYRFPIPTVGTGTASVVVQ
ncbi:MAG: hypothetical protein KGR26_05875 [Cyanobacteria bacterium REEB65]|nr:hypothetical protein [Cyanobacteria bacterium REEB65]